MISQDSIMYSLRNLAHRKGRSFLTVFSILVGIATIFIFISYGYGLFTYTDDLTTGSSADKLLIMSKGGGPPGSDTGIILNDDDVKAIEKAAGVIEATPMYYSPVEIERRNEIYYASIISYDPTNNLMMEMFNIGPEKGRLLRSGDDKKVVLGYNYLLDDKIFTKGLEVNDVIDVNGIQLKVIGFFEAVGNPADDSQLYVTNDYYEEMFPNKTSYFEIIARADKTDIAKAQSNVERSLRNSRDLEEGKEDFFVQTFEDMLESFSAALNIIIAFVILIALISVLVSAVNTANTMITSVLERYKEIGVLKSIGARNTEILNIFLFESSFLGFVAGVLGVGLGYVGTEVADKILTAAGYGFLSPHYSVALFVGCILFAVLTGAISGVIPAIRASKINTVDALRYE
ncbi:MAG: ABC transporter permease [Nanoarchaeota archaeon]|jgi:putative ABC transport system permease protein|nr:ABC transporter permease [Nanoarchaeota archaeon]